MHHYIIINFFKNGKHLENINMEMRQFSAKETSTEIKNLKNNETPRYHYFEFDEMIPIVPSVVDFKHYFSLNVTYLLEHKEKNFVCSISELYREQLSQRFSNYLARIGLPDLNSKES